MADVELARTGAPSSRADAASGSVRLILRGIDALGDLLMPPLCLACHEPLGAHDALCSACWRGIDFIRPPLCDRLGLPMPFDAGGVMVSAAAAADPPAYHRARAVARYDGVMRDLIQDLKFRDRHAGRRLFGRWLLEAGGDLVAEAHVVVPVPLNRWRLLRRRFNQAAILAREVSRLAALAYEPTALVRARATESQVGLTRAQRRRNVRGAFAIPRPKSSSIAGRNILLVDDVITTGATVGACAEALRRAGAARVDVLALALVTDEALMPS